MIALVPEPILQAITPGLVADYCGAHPQIIKKTFLDRTRPAYDPVRVSLFCGFRDNADVIYQILSAIQVSYSGGALSGQINNTVAGGSESKDIIDLTEE